MVIKREEQIKEEQVKEELIREELIREELIREELIRENQIRDIINELEDKITIYLLLLLLLLLLCILFILPKELLNPCDNVGSIHVAFRRFCGVRTVNMRQKE